MNWILSAFDASTAELLVGQKLRASFVSAANKGNANMLPVSLELDSTSTKKKQEGQSSSSKTPRFALELDGLNCFETIVDGWFDD